MSENIHPLPAVRSPKQREHHVGLLGIYFSAEPCQARPKMGWLGCGWSSQASPEESWEGACRSIRCLCCNYRQWSLRNHLADQMSGWVKLKSCEY